MRRVGREVWWTVRGGDSTRRRGDAKNKARRKQKVDGRSVEKEDGHLGASGAGRKENRGRGEEAEFSRMLAGLGGRCSVGDSTRRREE